MIRQKKYYFLSAAHSIFLIFITFLWLSQPYAFEDEIILVKISSYLKRLFLKIEKKPPPKDFLFINTAYDLRLIDKFDEDSTLIGNQAITDRAKLARLLQILNRHSYAYRYIVCDIFFKDPSPEDSLLRAALSNCKKIITSNHLDNNKKAHVIQFDTPTGISDYKVTYDNALLKFSLFVTDTLKSLPLKLYENVQKVSVQRKGMFCLENNRLLLNSYIPDFRLRYHDLQTQNYPMVHLGELLALPPEFILEIIKDRILVLGDFLERDKHETIYGSLPGALILINIYYNLVLGDNEITIFFILFLFVAYFWLFNRVFFPTPIKKWLLPLARIHFLSVNLLGAFFSFTTFFVLLSLVCYFLFNIHICVLFLSAYFSILLWVYKWLRLQKLSK